MNIQANSEETTQAHQRTSCSTRGRSLGTLLLAPYRQNGVIDSYQDPWRYIPLCIQETVESVRTTSDYITDNFYEKILPPINL